METLELPDQQTMEIIVFKVADICCGIDIISVQEINQNTNTTMVSGASDIVKGVINLRGEIVSIIDMCVVFKTGSIEVNKNTRNLVVRSGDELIGLLVDETSDIIVIEKSKLVPPPSNIDKHLRMYISGVYQLEDELVAVLNIEKVLAIEPLA